MALAMGIK